MSPENSSGTVDLKELEYQESGIVSRILLKQPSGSVTAFAFDEGQELSEHTCPYEALISVVDGVGEVTIGGEPHRVATGEMIVLPAGVPHAVHAPERFKMLLTIIRA